MRSGLIISHLDIWQMSVGDDIHQVILLMEKLYNETGLSYFKSQCKAWSQWVWMLSDNARQQWNVTYPGSPNGEDVCVSEPTYELGPTCEG